MEQIKKDKKIGSFLYLILAFLTLCTISFSLFLNIRIVDQFKSSVAFNLYWVDKMNELSELACFVDDATHPPDHIFVSKNPNEELQILSESHEKFELAFSLFIDDINRKTSLEEKQSLLPLTDNVHEEVKILILNGQKTILSYQKGQIEEASLYRGEVGKHYTNFNQNFDDLYGAMMDISKKNLATQQENMVTSTLYQKIVISGVLFVLGLIIFYGRHLSKKFDLFHKEQESLIQELVNYKKAIDEHAIVSLADLDGRICDVNQKFLDICFYKKEELIGKNYRILDSGFHPASFWKKMWETISSGQIWENNIKNRSKTGSFYWIQTSIIPFKDKNGKILQYISVGTDITASKNQEADLILSRDKAEASEKAKGMFLANMSHEIRTPLNAIIGFSDLLKKTPLNEKQTRYIETILSSGNLLLSVINDILDFSKLQAGKATFESLNFDLEALVCDAFKIIQSKAVGKPISLFMNVKKNTPTTCQGDPNKLKQVLINLLGNALKFTDRGEIGIVVELKETLKQTNEYLIQFTVADTGIGIPQNKIHNLFCNFEQADQSTTRKYGGTGLGLAITKSIVEAMGGSIHIESQEGIGSKFIFEIKLKESMGAVSQTSYIEEDLSSYSVMVVEDNLAAQEILIEHLKDFGCTVSIVTDNGLQALNLLYESITHKTPPDIIVSDLILPQLSGHELIKKIRSDPLTKDIKALAISSDMSPGISEKVLQEGFNAFLSKPYTRRELIHSISSLLKQHKATPSISSAYTLKDGIKKPSPSSSSKKIFIVEDVEANRLLMKAYCDILGYEVTFACNGQEAIDLLQTTADFAVCFMDFQMPVMDGIAATLSIRKNISKTLPIIGLTAAVLKEEQERLLASGMNDVIFKPVALDKLKSSIEKYNSL